MLKLLLLLLHRNLQRAICGCEQQWAVISLRLRRVDIVVERVSLLLRLVDQVMLLLVCGRRRRSVVVVEVVKALVRVLAWVGRIGDGMHHVGQWVLGRRRLLARLQAAGGRSGSDQSRRTDRWADGGDGDGDSKRIEQTVLIDRLAGSDRQTLSRRLVNSRTHSHSQKA